MIKITMDAILIPLKENSFVAFVFVLGLRIMHSIAINWATMTYPLLMLNLQINIYK